MSPPSSRLKDKPSKKPAWKQMASRTYILPSWRWRRHSSETSVNFNQTTRHYTSEYRLLWRLIFWHIRLCSLVKVNRRFGIYRLHLSGRRVRKAKNYHEFFKPEDGSEISFRSLADRHYIPEGRAFHSDRSKNHGSSIVKYVASQ
jgi:hypothetical protein